MSSQDSSQHSSSESPSAGNPSNGSPDSTPYSRIVVLGGGEAGTAVLTSLSEAGLAADVTLIEPSLEHFDQADWMRVGTEGVEKEETRFSKQGKVPSSVTWVQEWVTEIDPEAQTVATKAGTTIRYDYLVMALGIETLWDRLRGVEKNLGTHGICSVYGYEQAEQAWEMIRDFSGGQAIFTAPSTPHKGGSAPFHILQRAAALWRESGVWARTELFFAVAAPTGIEAETYETPVGGELDIGDIHVRTGYDLIEVRPSAQEAVFNVEKGQSQSRDVLPYDLLHVVPPMRPPALLEQSGLAHRNGPMKGYMEVRPESLQHKRFHNVFGVGDAVGVEGVKTGERAREQAVAVAQTLADTLGTDT